MGAQSVRCPETDSDQIAHPTGRLPALKRGTDNQCASGAIEIGTGLVNRIHSCDRPASLLPQHEFLPRFIVYLRYVDRAQFSRHCQGHEHYARRNL